MSGEALVQYALQLQGAAAACDPCSPGNPCKNEGTCFIQHATGFIPAGGTRILQTGKTPAGKCDASTMASYAAEIDAQCCGADNAACSRKVPTSCDVGCAAVLLPFWADCFESIQFWDSSAAAADFEKVVALCEARRSLRPVGGSCPRAATLAAKCGSAIAAGVGNCIVCVAKHFACDDDGAIDAFCSDGGGKAPAPPPPPGGFMCECAKGWRGHVCDQATGCDGSPCGEHGTCTASGGSYACDCATGWSGPRCDVHQCALPYTTVSDAWRGTDHASGDKGGASHGPWGHSGTA
jgi:hypothetical protein